MLVKVHCKDRRGLLLDVIAALKMLPVAVVAASINTTDNGTVQDVFEVSRFTSP